jgi:ribonuclease HII
MIHELEKHSWDMNRCVAGIDEAGRGPLAGPCVVSCVVLPVGYTHKTINDSKQLSEKKREACYEDILRDALSIAIIAVSEATIDRDNIYQATKKAMIRLAQNAPADLILTDAMPFTLQGKEIVDLIKGDTLSISIAAASIVAKVTRDRLMVGYDLFYPKYGFAKHKGYPTREHIEAIREYGILPIHRMTYGPIREIAQLRLF